MRMEADLHEASAAGRSQDAMPVSAAVSRNMPDEADDIQKSDHRSAHTERVEFFFVSMNAAPSGTISRKGLQDSYPILSGSVDFYTSAFFSGMA